jgi:hypothetical protein
MRFTRTGGSRRRPPARLAMVLIVEDMDYFVEIARDALGGRYG